MEVIEVDDSSSDEEVESSYVGPPSQKRKNEALAWHDHGSSCTVPNKEEDNDDDSVIALDEEESRRLLATKKQRPGLTSSLPWKQCVVHGAGTTKPHAGVARHTTTSFDSDDESLDSLLNFEVLRGPKSHQQLCSFKHSSSAQFQTPRAMSLSDSTSASSKKPPSSLTNPYAKKPSPQSFSPYPIPRLDPEIFPIETFPYPKLLDHSRCYNDLRAAFLKAIWKKARQLTHHSHHRQKLDQAVKKVVQLSLWPYPLRSLDDFCHRFVFSTGSIGQDKSQKEELEKLLREGGFDENKTVMVGTSGGGRRYCSIPEACLVAMRKEIETRRQAQVHSTSPLLQEALSSREMWISLRDLIPAIDSKLRFDCPGRMLREKDPDGGVEYYLNKSSLSAEFQQINKLKNMMPSHTSKTNTAENNGCEGYIKPHTYKKQIMYELTPLGWHTSQWIEQRSFPSPPGHYRTSHVASLDWVEATYKDICLCVDFREGGLNKRVLHKMCSKLDMKRIPYFVGTLDIGDYAFFWTQPGRDQGKLCPILVERKSVQDIALSIKDGRWQSQKRRMYRGQYVFGYGNCRVVFIIEGNSEKQAVTNGYIGHRKHGVDHERLDREIANLQSEGFEVIRTSSTEHSMFELTRWAEAIGNDVRSGKLKLQFTFQEFKEKVKEIPGQTDFSRLAKYHKGLLSPQKESPVVNQSNISQPASKTVLSTNSEPVSIFNRTLSQSGTKAMQETIDLCSSDDDSSGTVQQKSYKSVPTPVFDRRRPLTLTTDVHVEPRFKPSSAVKVYMDSTTITQSPLEKKRKRSCTENGDDLEDLSIAELRARCVELGLAKSGTKSQMLERLTGPKPPKVWLERKKRGEYVPSRYDTGASALLVALYLHERTVSEESNVGLSKEELYSRAEALQITKNPFSGGTTQTGPYHYDGWSSMSSLLKGDPALVKMGKHRRYKLTRSGPLAGWNLAQAMHKWCQEHGVCS